MNAELATHSADRTPVKVKARLCRRKEGELPSSSQDSAFETEEARLANEPIISGAAAMAPRRANWPCCQHGIIAPCGWLDRIVVYTIVDHAAVVARPVAA
eukprot:837728_1